MFCVVLRFGVSFFVPQRFCGVLLPLEKRHVLSMTSEHALLQEFTATFLLDEQQEASIYASYLVLGEAFYYYMTNFAEIRSKMFKIKFCCLS